LRTGSGPDERRCVVNVEVVCEPGPEEGKTTVLVVEDEVLIRLMIADALRAEGIDVIEASNGEEAMRVLQSALPIQLLLTDIRMASESDGLKLAHAARAAHPGLKVIVASSQVSDDEVTGLAHAFFSKPYNLVAIVDRVKSLLSEVHHARQRR
jgi:DNA-binding NtrC family response regulator